MDTPPAEWDEGPGLIESISRYKVLVAALVVIIAVLAYAWSARQPTRYQGVVQVFLNGSDSSADPGRLVRGRAEFIQSPAVLDKALTLSHSSLTRKELGKDLSVTPSLNTDLVTVSVMAPTPRAAARLADSVALAERQVLADQTRKAAAGTVARLQKTQQVLASQLAAATAASAANPGNPELKAEVDAKSKQLVDLVTQKEQANVAAARAEDQGPTPEPAAVPDSPAAPKPAKYGLIGAMLGAVIGAALAWWRNDRRYKARRQAAQPAPADGNGTPPDDLRRRLKDLVPQPSWSPFRTRTAQATPESQLLASSIEQGAGDFDRLTNSIQQLFASLDGPRERLYRRRAPQYVADEVAERFHVDPVAVLLEHDDALQVAGQSGQYGLRPPGGPVVGYGTDLLDTLTSGGPRLAGEAERGLLQRAGLPGSEAEMLLLVPLAHEGTVFGVLLAGKSSGNGSSVDLSDHDIANITHYAEERAHYLRAWQLLRTLTQRLESFDATAASTV